MRQVRDCEYGKRITQYVEEVKVPWIMEVGLSPIQSEMRK